MLCPVNSETQRSATILNEQYQKMSTTACNTWARGNFTVRNTQTNENLNEGGRDISTVLCLTEGPDFVALFHILMKLTVQLTTCKQNVNITISNNVKTTHWCFCLQSEVLLCYDITGCSPWLAVLL